MNGYEKSLSVDLTPLPITPDSIEVVLPEELKQLFNDFLYGNYEADEDEFDLNQDLTNLLSHFPESNASKIKGFLNGEFENITDEGNVVDSDHLLAMIVAFSQYESNGDEVDLSHEAYVELQQIISETYEVKFNVIHDKFTTLLSEINNQFANITITTDSKLSSKLNNISNLKLYQMINHEVSQPLQQPKQMDSFKLDEHPMLTLSVKGEGLELNNKLGKQTQTLGSTQEQMTQVLKEMLVGEEASITDLKKLVANLAEEIPHTNLDKGIANTYFNQLIRRVITDTLSNGKNNESSIELIEFESYLDQQSPVGIKPESIANKDIVSKTLMSIFSDATQSLTLQNNDIDVVKPVLGLESTPMSKIQQFVIHVGQNPTANQSHARTEFIQQFYEIVSAGKFRTFANGHSQMVIKFNPDHLGSVIVKLSQLNGDFTAKIITASNSAKELVESNISQLRALFSAQNITVDKLETYSQAQYSDLLKDSEQSNTKKEQQGDTTPNNESESIEAEDTFSERLLEEIVNLQV